VYKDLSGHHSNPPKPLESFARACTRGRQLMSSRAGRGHTGRFEHVGRRRRRCCFARHQSVSAATELTLAWDDSRARWLRLGRRSLTARKATVSRSTRPHAGAPPMRKPAAELVKRLHCCPKAQAGGFEQGRRLRRLQVGPATPRTWQALSRRRRRSRAGGGLRLRGDRFGRASPQSATARLDARSGRGSDR
jgi:hypothetical protein